MSYKYETVLVRLPDMNKQIVDENVITDYLLGSLPEEETVRLDEMSFTDDEFASALSVAEKDLVDAYIQGELTGKRLEQFNSYYLASPRRREKVRFAKAFQTYAEKEAATETVFQKNIESEKKKVSWFNRFFSFPSFAFQWGLAAASIVLLLVVGWLAYDNYQLRQEEKTTQARRDALQQREKELEEQLKNQQSNNSETVRELERVRDELAKLEEQKKQLETEQRKAEEQRRAQSQKPNEGGNASIVAFNFEPPKRGAGQPVILNVPASADYLSISLELETDDFPLYRVALKNTANNQTLWQSGKLKARTKGNGKTLAVRFRSGLLKEGNYIFEVSGLSAEETTENIIGYPFRVVKQ